MNLLIILLVLEQNGMYIPAGGMGLAWVVLAVSGLAGNVKGFIEEGGARPCWLVNFR